MPGKKTDCLKGVSQLLETPIGQDASLFLAPGQDAPDGVEVTEIRFTLAATSDEEVAALVAMLEDSKGAESRKR